jgi:hypothetical protein
MLDTLSCMKQFTDQEALDLLVEVKKHPTRVAHLTEEQIERMCRRILGNLSDDEFAKVVAERMNVDRTTYATHRPHE